MAKRTKKATSTKRRSQAPEDLDDPPGLASPFQVDFKQARDLLRQRADALILDLAKLYVESAASELTTVLDAMDSLAEFERMRRPAVGVTVPPSSAGRAGAPAEGRTGPPTTSGISFIANKVMATGTVTWFNPQKGFGFIVDAANGRDVFVHISAVEKAGLTKLNEGQQIEFELEESRGKACAANLKLR